MNNTLTPSSRYFHIYYGNENKRTLREDSVGKQNENPAAAILIMAEKHPECSVDKITNIERIDFNKDIFYKLEDEGIELKLESEAFLYAVENSPTEKDFDKEDLFVALRLLSNVKKKIAEHRKND